MYSLITVAFEQSISRYPMKHTIVISEPAAKLISRNKKSNSTDNFVLLLCVEITKKEYEDLKPYNPTNEWYLKVARKDMSKFIVGE